MNRGGRVASGGRRLVFQSPPTRALFRQISAKPDGMGEKPVMKRSRSLRAWLVLMAWFVSSVSAAEPARQFLDALRERHYFDVALDYLDQLATDPVAPVDLKEVIVFEKGATLIEASRFQKDSAIRENQLNDAQQLLKQFVSQHGEHSLASAARNHLGNVVMERARIAVESSKTGNKATLQAEAKKRYEEAYDLFAKSRQDLTTQLDRIPKFLDEKDKQAQQLAIKRSQLRSDYLEALLSAAVVREEMADTVDPQSREFAELLTDAARQYGEICESYRSRLPGLIARLYQGRCHQKLRRFPEALGFLTETIDQPADTDAVREVICKALRHAMQCWLDPSQKQYVTAIKRAEDWIAIARAKEELQSDWLAVRLLLARAYMMQADAVKAIKPKDKLVDQSLTSARKHAGFVAKINSEHQNEAQSLVAQLLGPDRTNHSGDPIDFAQAKEAGKEAIDVMQTTARLIKEISAQIDRERDSAVKVDLQGRLDDANQTLTVRTTEALRLCNAALSLVDQDTTVADINYIRYLLCLLHYNKQQYFEAAILGEFVAKRSPDSAGARQCAKIAMASYVQLYSENKAADKTFEADRVVSIAEFIAISWPDQPEAEDALRTLIPFMINAGQLPRALELIAKIPESSESRGEVELQTGRSLWAAYLKGLNEALHWEKEGAPTGVDLSVRKSELRATKSKATELLTTGYNRIQQKTVVDSSSAMGVLSLAQVYVESQQPLEAIEVLEHSALGPLKLVADKHPAAMEPGFVEETYKTALRAYIGALPVAPDRAAMQSKAQDTMNKMNDAIGHQQDGQQRLIAVFVSLARSVEEQLKVAQPDSRKVLSESFESFLQQIRTDTDDFHILNWIAETFSGLGGGFDNAKELVPEAKHYYDESIATFTKILSATQLDSQMKLQIQLRLAIVLRRSREFEKSIEIYKDVLTTSNMLVNIQVEAARTYQEWGAASTDTAPYERAINGAFPDAARKNIIWGWGRTSQVTARYPKFRDTFHEASVHLAQCRVRLAERMQGADKDKLLKSAFNGIVVVYRLIPDLGGDKWMPQYDTVLIQVQKAQGTAPAGIKALAPLIKTPPGAVSGVNATTPVSASVPMK